MRPLSEEEARFVVSPSGGPVDWDAVFNRGGGGGGGGRGGGGDGSGPPELELEIGAGKGVFLCRIARARPDSRFVAVEIRLPRVLKIARRLAVEKIANARVIHADARAALAAFSAGSVARVYLNFPDPWPKRRHAKRRIFRGTFPEALHRILAPGGVWFVATDVAGYAREMLEAVEAGGCFLNAAGMGNFSERPEEYPASIHEEKFRAWGRPIYFLRWIKR